MKCTSLFVLLFGAFAAGSAQQEHRLLTAPQAAEIHIDEECRIYEIVPHSGGKRTRVYTDRGICDVGTRDSWREETDVQDGRRKREDVEVREWSYVLHNPTPDAVTFVLTQRVPKGWRVDSDPQPNKLEGTTASFFVVAQAGQTINLHVGERKPAE